jgi:outer membrane protein OmpA-like peptidoglycan-associated protein
MNRSRIYILPLSFTLFVLQFSFFTLHAQELQPTDNDALLKVSVIDEKNTPMASEKVSFESETTKKLYGGITDANGKFNILIPKGCVYDVKYRQFTSDATYGKKVTVPTTGDLLTFNYTIRVQLPKTYTLHNVFFDTGKATLRAESNKELDELFDFLSHQKNIVIEVGGYTDNVGTDADNLKLSQARAESVRNYLVKKGIAGDRVQAKGYGSSDPVASNDTPEGKQQNRRTEIHILKS